MDSTQNGDGRVSKETIRLIIAMALGAVIIIAAIFLMK